MKFLKSLLPSHRHAQKIKKRKAALERLSAEHEASQQAFAQALRDDPELDIRLLACRRLNDLALLQKYSGEEHPEALREAATHRYRQLLLGHGDGGLDSDQRIAALEQVEEKAFLETLAVEAKGAAFRIAVLARIDRQALLGDIAINDSDAEVRWSAAQRIEKPGTLERVAKGAKNRDKRVCNWAKEQLAKRAADKAKPAQLKETAKKICDELSVILHQCRSDECWLNRQDKVSELQKRWEAYKHQWRELKCGRWDDSLEERYHKAIDTFDKKADSEREQKEKEKALEAQLLPHKNAMQAVCEQLSKSLSSMKESKPSTEEAGKIQALLDETKQQWQQIDKDAIEKLASLKKEYVRLSTALAEQQKAMLDHIRGGEKLANIVQRLDALKNKGKPITSQALKGISKQLSSLPANTTYPLNEEELSKAKECLQAMQDKLDEQEKQRIASLDTFIQLIPQIESNHKEGESKKAVQLLRRAQKLLGDFSEQDQSTLRKQGVVKRFQAIRKQVEDLQDWKRWSSAPIKERLLNDLEKLAQEVEENKDNPDFDFPDTAQRIRSARDEWKSINVRERGESPELWQRFDAACNSAYAHCQAFFNHQHELKDKALEVRQSTCEGLEKYAERIPAQIEAGNMDWKALELVIRTAESDWKKLGEVHFRAVKTINKRFRSAMNKLRQYADEERQRNQEAKQKLITRAEAIVSELNEEQFELQEAIEKIKELQVKWKEIGAAKGEGELWKSFRKHCDEVFNQRAAASQAYKDEQANNLASKQALIEKIEALAKLEGEALRHARADLEKIKHEWNEIGYVPKKESGAVNRAYESACRQFEQQDGQRVVLVEKEKWDALSKRADVCTQLEHALEKGEADLERFQTQWQALAEERCIARTEIDARFNAALALKEDNTAIAQRLQQGLEARLQLCLELEILAGIDSPEDYAKARMEYQVYILADQMKQSDDNLKREDLLNAKIKWHTTHSAPQNQTAELDARYQRCMTQLNKDVEQALLESLEE